MCKICWWPEDEHRLVHGDDWFFQPEVRRVAGAEQFGREHVVALERLHDLAVADGGLFQQVDQLERRVRDGRQVFDFGDEFLGGHNK